ncbi:MAG: long-chain acyl-CoA synthetase [Patiriisocius sp.]|jgi:long-chain acyl-CoA synthetase
MSIQTLADITRHHGATRPDKVALIYTHDQRSWTYGQLDQESNQCANALQAAGVGSQDRVAYLGHNAPEYFTWLFGTAKLNAVSVAVNWRLAPPEMEYILNHSDAKVLLIGEEFLPHLAQMNLDCPHIVVLGSPGDTGYPTYQQLILSTSIEDPGMTANPEDTVYQLYTSGTTGLPKGVLTTHTNLLSVLGPGLESLGFNEGSVNLVCMPLFHISGSGWGLTGIFNGATSILLRDVDMQEILRVIPAFGVTHSVFVPAVLQFLLAQPNVRQVDYSSLQCIAYGASPITEQVLVDSIATFGANFFQVYGLTETTGGVTMLMPEDHDPGGPRAELLRSCGKAVAKHEVCIVDRESGQQVAEGEAGEIWMRGPQIMRGYWKNDEATEQSITEDGWFKSGDAGYMVDGFVYIHDRVKDMVISGGENIYPAEVENALMKHPGVSDVAVIGVPDDRWGETVKAIVTRSSEEITEEQLFAFCRKNLASYKCPTSFDWMDLIPRNPSGKILKTELRKPYWAGRTRNVS